MRESFWLQSMMAGFPASYFCIKAFSETDLTEDLKRFDVPTLVLHGDDDQIVPIKDSALLSSKIIKNAKLVIYEGAPHGMCTTLKDRVNEELLAFIKGGASGVAKATALAPACRRHRHSAERSPDSAGRAGGSPARPAGSDRSS